MGKKIQCLGRYVMDCQTLGKGSFARVELATHGVTGCKVRISRCILHFFLQKILLSSATLKLWLKLSVLFSLSRKYTYNRTYTTICIHAERTLIIVKFIN